MSVSSQSQPPSLRFKDDRLPWFKHPLAGTLSSDDIDAVKNRFLPYARLSSPWDAYEIVSTGILTVLLLLPRMFMFVIILVFQYAILRIALLGVTDFKEFNAKLDIPKWRRFLIGSVPYLCRVLLFLCFGIYRINISQPKHTSMYNDPHGGDDFSNMESILGNNFNTNKNIIQRDENQTNNNNNNNINNQANDDDGKSKNCSNDTKHQHRKFNQEKHPFQPVCVVANHLGYVEILALEYLYRGSFLCKADIATTPFVGLIAHATCAMFLKDSGGVTQALVDRLKETDRCRRLGCKHEACHRKIIIFPEGTTTNGFYLVKFRTGVFHAGLPVKPVVVRFPFKHFNMSWESILFKEHLWRAMTQWVNHIDICELPDYYPSQAEIRNPKLYAQNVERLFEKELDTSTFLLNRNHKLIYHSFLMGKLTSEQALRKADDVTENDTTLSPCQWSASVTFDQVQPAVIDNSAPSSPTNEAFQTTPA